MRKLKFRAWSAVKKQWVENMLLLACIDGLPFAHFVEVDTETNITKHHVFNASELDLTIQQYTGLKDRNGKDIYEGDIIKVKLYEKWLSNAFHEANHIVFYNSDRGSFVHALNPETFKSGMTFDPYTFDPLQYELIGNIFETPELLRA